MVSRRAEPGAAEYRALVGAMEHTTPTCLDDWRFSEEQHDIDEGDRIRMRGICRTCPLADLCDAYGQSARPTSGMWAGSYYKPSNGSRKGTR